MDIPEVPQVFFIRGVFKHTARSIQEVIESRPTPPEEHVEPLLTSYRDWSDEEWLAQRSVQCATCPRAVGRVSDEDRKRNDVEGRRSPPERQIFIPSGLERHREGTVWTPHDTVRFCCWPCAQYHIVYFLKNDDRFSRLLKHLYSKWNGNEIPEIAIAEHPWRCIERGGDRTLDELHRINDFNMSRLSASFEEDRPDEDDDE
jgi:hypothetical protein